MTLINKDVRGFYAAQGVADIQEKSQNQFTGLCPNCNDGKKDHFYFNTNGQFNCYGCQVDGNAVTFLKQFKHITDDKKINNILKQYGLNNDNSGNGASEKKIITCPSQIFI